MIMGMFFFLIIFIVVLFGFRITQYMVTAAYVEDALAASNLASAVIDLKEYGKNHTVCIQDPEKAFLLYREALCHNLGTDEALQTTNSELLAADVTILEFIIYNIRDEQVEIYVLDGKGRMKEYRVAQKGEVYTPDHVKVETATIYSRVGFYVNGLMEQLIYAEKEKSIDIVRYEGE